METERGIGVVGAGPSGLAAAWRLSESGRSVRVYESTDRVGGRLRTERVGGVGADAVVQLLSAEYTGLREMAAALGVEGRLVPVPGKDALWREGSAHPLRYGSVMSMVGSGALPMGLKARLGLRYVPFLERHRRVLDLNHPAGAAEAGLGEESIAAWGRRTVGPEFVELMVRPLLAAYYGLEAEETSATFFHALARSGMHVEVLGARGGMAALAADLASALTARGVEVRTGVEVRGVEALADGARVLTGGAPVEHDAVVVATPVAVAARLLPLPALADVATRSTASLVLATRSPTPTGWFGLSIPRSEPVARTLAAICVQEEKETGVTGGAGGALVLVPAPEAGRRWAERAPADVLGEALPAVEEVLPGVTRQVVEARLVRLRDTVWIPAPGHFRRLERFTADLPDRIALAGDYLVSPTVEGAVRSGLAAAERVTAAGW